MAVPKLNSCCCGCSLETGTKIIGWLQLIGSIILVALTGMGLAGLYYIEQNPDSAGKDADIILAEIGILKAMFVFFIFGSLVGCAFAFILLLGTYQGKANLIYIWVIITLTLSIIGVMGSFLEFFFVPKSNVVTPNIWGMLIGYSLEFYFILVVYSYYCEIRNVPANYA